MTFLERLKLMLGAVNNLGAENQNDKIKNALVNFVESNEEQKNYEVINYNIEKNNTSSLLVKYKNLDGLPDRIKFKDKIHVLIRWSKETKTAFFRCNGTEI